MKKTNMFIFEPCSWSHCGGAIAVIANTFDQAVHLAREACTDADDEEQYDGVFSRDRKDMKKDCCDQWLLTGEFRILNDKNPRVVVNNWNYS
jgi:hypothetical protein